MEKTIYPPVEKILQIKCEMEKCARKQDYKILSEVSNFVQLPCDHSLCTECFKEHCNLIIKGEFFKKPEDLTCPKQNCNQNINYWHISDNLPGLVKECENKTYSNDYYINFGKVVDEGCCGENVCCQDDIPGCNEDKPASPKPNDGKLNLKECPNCKVMIQKTGGCHVIRCNSAKCQKKTVFCFLCSEILKTENENSHYLNNNNYKNCVNVANNK